MSLDLCAVGNALVDIIVSTDDQFLEANAITKGAMTLMDDTKSRALTERAGTAAKHSSGGSAANTLAGLASLGGTGAFIGKVGDDPLGALFARELNSQNLTFASKPDQNLSTGRSLIFVTPDAQRSMNTYLGAAAEFGPDDIDEKTVQDCTVTYMEGYLFDKSLAQRAFYKASEIAHDSGRKVALTLSDSFCVARHRDAFLDLIEREIDILFANEGELKELFALTSMQEAIEKVRLHTEIAVITRGSAGAFIVTGKTVITVPATPVNAVIDTTGAGDLFAAGVLFGITHRKTLEEAGRIGAVAAAEIIGHFGPRPETRLSALI